jgi:hypothetical protein
MRYGVSSPFIWFQETQTDSEYRLEDDLVLGGALLVADAFAVYSWSPERRLWIPVRVQVMMVDASNHCGWDPGRD